MVSSTASVTSTVSSNDGLVMISSVPGSDTSSPPGASHKKEAGERSSYASSTDSDIGSGYNSNSSRRNSSEEPDSVDGLVLMGSTRLRPAPEIKSSMITKAKLYIQTFKSMFVRNDCTTAILPLALHGNLQNNPFR